MNPSALFISRPATTTLITIGAAVFGLMAYRELPVSDLPPVDFPTIQVQASLPGASPEAMAASVALPLEKQFGSIPGLTSMSSTSVQGSTSITLQFELERDIDAAAQDVQAMIGRASRSLPPAMPAPPSYQKVNPGDQPVLFAALVSSALPLSVVDEYAQQMVAQRISMVSGVAQVDVPGSQKYAVRVDVDPRQLAARSIGIDEVAAAIADANGNLPTGNIYGDQTFVVQTNGRLLRAAAFGPTIVAYRNGHPVRLHEVARVYDGVENTRTAAWQGKERCIYLLIRKQPGSNVVDVVNRVKALFPSIREQLPAGIALELRSDRSVPIRESVHDVKLTLLLTIALVVFVIFLFLRSLSATVIASLALPISLVTTFAVMYLLDFSLDNLSLMALTLSVGFVVDDAIVMLENVVRHMEMGKSPLRAALDGSKEIAFTIASMTLSLAAVFIPVLFMGGVVGRLLSEFGVTIAVAILISGAVSISLTPMLCSRFLRPLHTARHGAVYTAIESVLDGSMRAYGWTLSVALRHRTALLVVSLMLVAGTGYLYVRIPKGFLPNEDQGRFVVNTEARQGISFDEMVRHQLAVTDIILEHPDVAAASANVGLNAGATNTGRTFVELKPRSERDRSVDEVIAALRPQVSQIPGLRVFMTNPPPINLGTGGNGARATYQFTLQHTDPAELYRWAQVAEDRMREMPGLQDVSSDLLLDNPQVTVRMDRDKLSALGLTVTQVESALYNAYGTRQVSLINAPNNQYQVIMQVAPEFQRDPAAMSLLYVRSREGRLVPLESVARFEKGTGPFSVGHFGQLPAVTISFNLAPGFALGDAVSQIRTMAASTLPASITTTFVGAAQAFQDSLQGLGLVLLMSIVVIYIVLGVLYESFTHPLTILSGLPSAGFGALLVLMAFDTELNLYAFVGVIMLVGLVKKNGIMMVDFAVEAQRTRGLTPLDAIHEACLVRFRPIMMTTMAALAGTMPIALGLGAGAESRRPLGLAVVGGLVVSQLLTLYLTPVYYVCIEHARMRWAEIRPRRRPVAAAGAAASVATDAV